MRRDGLKRTLLLDYYGELLTQKQRLYCDLYYNQDYSLAEIAEQTGISRQGVRDAVARGEKTLLEIEQRLHLIEKDVRIRRLVRSLESELLAAAGEDRADPRYAKLFSLLSELSDITEGNDGI